MKKASTLIEVLVALAILGLIAGITAVSLRQSAPDNLLRVVSRAIATDIRYASELAVSTQTNHAVRFYPETSQYSVVALETPERVIKTVSLDPNLTFGTITLPSNTVEFNSIGAARNPGIVTLKHQNGTQQILDIRPSGYVQIR